jgi:surfeit locus 1 family protein
MSPRSRIIGTLLVLVVAAVCIRLGFWQLSRLGEKRAINAAVAERSAQTPVRLNGTVRDSTGLIFRPATASGLYDNDRTIILPGRSHRGAPGVLVLTPLRLADGTAVLVQRGWAPSPDGVSIDLDPMRVDTAVTISGLVLPFPGAESTLAGRARDVEPADTFRRVWYAVEADRLRAAFPYTLLPVRLQRLPQTESAPADSTHYPLAQAAPALDEGPHLGYAIQWFSFALIFLIGWVALLWSRRVRPAEESRVG